MAWAQPRLICIGSGPSRHYTIVQGEAARDAIVRYEAPERHEVCVVDKKLIEPLLAAEDDD